MKTNTAILTEQQGVRADGSPYCLGPFQHNKGARLEWHIGDSIGPPAPLTIVVPEDRMWAFELAVYDAAGNVRKVRHLSLVDTAPTVTVSGSQPVLISSAGNQGATPPDARELWQTSTDMSYSVTWAGVFSDHKNEPWLKPVTRDGVHELEEEYDHVSLAVPVPVGQLNVFGVPNQLGLTRFETRLVCISCQEEGDEAPWADAQGTTPGSVPPVSEYVERDLGNGNWFRFEVRASNVFGVTAVAMAEPFGVDITPPELVDFSLEKHGEKGLAAHSMHDLQAMELSFRAYDTESGLRQIDWSIHAHEKLQPGEPEAVALVDFASIQVKPVATQAECHAHGAEACVCNEFVEKFCFLRDYRFPVEQHPQLIDSAFDRHGQNFTVTLTITNRAGLTTTTVFPLIVDLTPPEEDHAAIMEGSEGLQDVDYQSDAVVTVRMRGFVDRESGIRAYFWAVGSSCEDEGVRPDLSDAVVLARYNRSTTDTIEYTALESGRYVFRGFVVNNAWEPSDVLCSDGVVVDTEAPQFAHVRIDNLAVTPGLVRTAEGAVWLVRGNATRVPVADADKDCVARATLMTSSDAVMLVPSAVALGPAFDGTDNAAADNARVPAVTAAEVCAYAPFVPTYFLGTEESLNVSWALAKTPAGNLHSVGVALASAPADGADPQGDILAFRTTTHQQNHMVILHDGLENGLELYVYLRVTKRSKQSTLLVLGPILLDAYPPMAPADDKLSLTAADALTLRATWNAWAGVAGARGVHYEIGVGAAATGSGAVDGILAFRAVHLVHLGTPDLGCNDAATPCASLPYASLAGQGKYIVAVRACNGAGHCGAPLRSHPQAAVPNAPPHAGLVFDGGLDLVAAAGLLTGEIRVGAPLLDTAPIPEDVDYQLSAGGVVVYWSHFATLAEGVSYAVGVGSTPDKADIAPFDDIDVAAASQAAQGDPWYTVTIGVELVPGQRVYALVRATNKLGHQVVSSDGIVALPPGPAPLEVFDGTRCENALSQLSAPVFVTVAAGELEAEAMLEPLLQPGHGYTLRFAVETVEHGSAPIKNGSLLLGSGHFVLAEDSLDGRTLELPFHATTVSSSVHLSIHTAAVGGMLKLRLLGLVPCFHGATDDGALVTVQSDLSATAGPVQGWWRWPANLTNSSALHVTHFEWALALDTTGGASRASSDALEQITPWTVAGLTHAGGALASTALPTGLSLEQHVWLVVLVRACHPAGCYNAEASPGRALVAGPPQSASIIARYTQTLPLMNSTTMTVRLQAFLHPVPPVLYQYSISHHAKGLGGLLVPWQTLEAPPADGTVLTDTRSLQLDLSLFDYHTIFVVVRAFGADGSIGLGSVAAETTTVLPPQHLAAVLDVHAETATGRGVLEKGAERDLAYTVSLSALGGYWPRLWPTFAAQGYLYSVSAERAFLSECMTVAEAKAHPLCGFTYARYAAVTNLPLAHGRTYFFCVRAGNVTLENSASNGLQLARPAVDTSCSNGITVDSMAPKAGRVVLGHAAESQGGLFAVPAHQLQFQSSTDRLSVRWSGFSDVEEADAYAVVDDASNDDADLVPLVPEAGEEGRSPHLTGIANYLLSVGTAPGGSDVFGPSSVGSSSVAALHGLQLPQGVSLFATVTAVDNVGLRVSASSAAIVVDSSPPLPGRVSAVVRAAARDGAGAVKVVASWTGFEDPESGVARCAWAIGRQARTADIAPFADAGLAGSGTTTVKDTYHGHLLTVTIRCYNRAGLFVEATSLAVVTSTQGPHLGRVYDGPTVGIDLDAQVVTDTLSATWEGFGDASAGGQVAAFAWAIGTAPGRYDVLAMADVARGTRSASARGLHLVAGRRYFVTVRACTANGVCAEAMSDGVVPDPSPPVAGRIFDGGRSYDLDVQATRNGVSASWAGFHDAQSGVVRYMCCFGSAPLTCDLYNRTDVGSATRMATMAVSLDADGVTRVFATVRGYNAAGLWVEAASNGVAWDAEPPRVVVAPHFIPVGTLVDDAPAGALPSLTDHQISQSVLRAAWQFADAPGRSLRYWYSIDTHHDGEPIAEQAVGLEDGFVLSGVALREGDIYYLRVTACDEAERCTTAKAERALIVDGSPPVRGHVVDDLLWEPSHLTLAWEGFADPHTAVHVMEVAVGTTFLGDNVVARQAVAASGQSPVGGVRLATRVSVSTGQLLFITLRAINAVGLKSQPAHSEARAMATLSSASSSTAVLQVILHQCDALFCDQRCTCGPHGICPQGVEVGLCVVRDGSPGAVQTLNVVIQDGFVWGKDADVQSERHALAASWTGTAGLRVQYMAGLKDLAPGASLFPKGAPEARVWLEAGHDTRAVFSVRPDRHLQHAATYVFYLRVWVDTSTYEEFVSDGVLIDSRAPLTRPASVRMLMDASAAEAASEGRLLDSAETSSAHGDRLAFAWPGAFSDDLGIAYYEWALGHYPFSTNLVNFTRVSAAQTWAAADGLMLMPWQEYYATVRAVDTTGLVAVLASGAMVVDVTAPISGTVLDGLGPHDAVVQTEADAIYASWFGFADDESGVTRFEVAVGRAGEGSVDSVIAWTDVGMATTIKLPAALTTGAVYATSVRAYNSLGVVSRIATSDGILVDMSAPIAERCLPANGTAHFGDDGSSVGVGNVVVDANFVHDPSNLYATAFAGAACGAGVEDEDEQDSGTEYVELQLSAPVAANVSLSAVSLQCATNNSLQDTHCTTAPSIPLDYPREAFALTCKNAPDLSSANSSVRCAFVSVASIPAVNRTRLVVSKPLLGEAPSLACAYADPDTVVCEGSATDGGVRADVTGVTCMLTPPSSLVGGDGTSQNGTFEELYTAGGAACVLQVVVPKQKARFSAVAQSVRPLQSTITADDGTVGLLGARIFGLTIGCEAMMPEGSNNNSLRQASVRMEVYDAASSRLVASSAAVSCPAQGSSDVSARFELVNVVPDPLPAIKVDTSIIVRVLAVHGRARLRLGISGSAGCVGAADGTPEPSARLLNGTWVPLLTGDAVPALNVQPWLVRDVAGAWRATSGASVVAHGHAGVGARAAQLTPRAVLTQSVTVVQGARYQLEFYVAPADLRGGAIAGCRVSVTSANHSATEATMVARKLTQEPVPQFVRHVLHFTAPAAKVQLAWEALPLMQNSAALLLARPVLRSCVGQSLQGASRASAWAPAAVDIGLPFHGDADRLPLTYHIVDAESGVVDMQWAAGTAPGGTQIQDFTSVHAVQGTVGGSLRLPHNATVFVTLAVRNGAGLTAHFAATPVRVDLTPPVITQVQGPAGVATTPAESDASVSFAVRIDAADEESGITWCTLAVGSQPGRADVAEHQPVTASARVSRVAVAKLLRRPHGTRVWPLLRCGNAAGRVAEQASEAGIIVLHHAPNASSVAVVHLQPVDPARVLSYRPRLGVQASGGAVGVMWEGFVDSAAAITRYEARLLAHSDSSSASSVPWVNVGVQQVVSFERLALEDGLYRVEVRAHDVAGQVSAAASSVVRVLSTKPAAGAGTLCATRLAVENDNEVALRLGWQGAFAASPCPPTDAGESDGSSAVMDGLDPKTCLQYEVNVGKKALGSDVARLQTTAVPALNLLRLALPIDPLTGEMVTASLHVTVTAVNAAGQATTREFTVATAPKC